MGGAAGLGTSYATGRDAFFVVDGDGIIRYRRTISQGPPSWRPAEVGPVVDQALADLVSAAGDVPARGEFTLGAAYPNPFNPTTRIPYRLDGVAAEVTVELRILDLRGRIVRTLVSERQATGREYAVPWDGRDDAGRAAPSGTYMANLSVEGVDRARFLTLVK